MDLPNKIFFTGVPGSKWSGIAQEIERIPGVNTSDRVSTREYTHNLYSGHVGAYFGRGMEFESELSDSNINQAHSDHSGTRLIKSHDWAYKLEEIESKFPNDWIMLVYRNDLTSYAWWHEAGGFSIKYPNYASYKNSANMLAEICKQNAAILEYSHKKNAVWSFFNEEWVNEIFGYRLSLKSEFKDVLVTLIK